MRNKLIYLVALLTLAFSVACQKSNTPNSTSSPNASSSPLPPSATPTPAIPDPNPPKSSNQPSGTPIPGIPDPKSLKNGKTPPLDEKTTPSKGPVTSGQANKRRP